MIMENGKWKTESFWMTAISLILSFQFSILNSSAAVPLTWTVETTRAQPATFEAYQGETLAFEAALQSRGKPLEASGIAALYWQTNGMGSTYWEASAAVNSNRLSAVFTPEMDVGAKVYNCFIGVPGTIYHAAFQLRLRPSPGATPNVLPLPVPVIDFAKVRVLNPPWPTSSGTDTNAVRDIAREEITAATNAIRKVDGAAKMLPKYLHERSFDDSYPEAAAMYYKWRQGGGAVPAPQCSAVRDGNFLYRNFDFPFDDRAEFVVKMSAGKDRFASVGVAQVGTNLTERIVTSGKPSRWYKALPGATVDGINERGVCAEINVVDGDPQTSGWHTTGDLHPLGAVRCILDHATNAQHAATYIAANIRFPQGWVQNFHYMIADECETWIVENGGAHKVGEPAVMTNFSLYPDYDDGMGWERFRLLALGANITNVWYTNAYRRETNPPWVNDLAEVIARTNDIYNAWATHPKEYFRGKTNDGIPWWQTVHTSVYDITNRTLRIAVQETDDWYVFAVPSAGGVKPEAVREIVKPMIGAATNGLPEAIVQKRDKTDLKHYKRGWILNGDPVPGSTAPDELATELKEILLREKPQFRYDESVREWKFTGYIGQWHTLAGAGGSPDDQSIGVIPWAKGGDIDHFFYANFVLSDDIQVESGDRLATTNGVRAVETNLTAKIDAKLAKSDVVAPSASAVAGQAADAKDTHDALVKKADEFKWVADIEIPSNVEEQPTVTGEYPDHLEWYWYYKDRSISPPFANSSSPLNPQTIRFYNFETERDFYASRKRVLRTGEAHPPLPYPTNAIPYSAITGAPTSVRTYDSVRHCWWVLEMVNGVPTWTVED